MNSTLQTGCVGFERSGNLTGRVALMKDAFDLHNGNCFWSVAKSLSVRVFHFGPVLFAFRFAFFNVEHRE